MTVLYLMRDCVSIALLAGIGLFAHLKWRRQVISCAEAWAVERGLSVQDWSKASVQMLRTSASVAFVASSPSERVVDVKLRLRVALLGGWRVGEVAYCLPRGVAEDDSRPASL